MKLIYIMLMLLIIPFTFGNDIQLENSIKIDNDYYQFISATEDGKIKSDLNTLAFIDTLSGDVAMLCELEESFGEYGKPPEWDGSSGASCDVGEYIGWVASRGDILSEVDSGDFIFRELWEKKNTKDVMYWKNTKYNNLDFTYFLMCYNCEIENPQDAEKGCLTEDKQHCVLSNDDDCDREYEYESVCFSHMNFDECHINGAEQCSGMNVETCQGVNFVSPASSNDFKFDWVVTEECAGLCSNGECKTSWTTILIVIGVSMLGIAFIVFLSGIIMKRR